jgi:hypothetical protein
MSKPNSNSKRPTKFRVEVVCGSTLKAAAAIYDLQAARPRSTRVHVRRLFFDPHWQPPADLLSSADGCRLAPGDVHVPADKPKGQASLDQAIREGLMRSADESSRQSEVPDNDGAGGIPRVGRERVDVNARPICNYLYQHIQKVIEYETTFADGEDIGCHSARVPVHVIASIVAGMGSGSLVWFVTEGILPCAQAAGVEAKIVPELLCMGNLQIHDGEQARLNQYLAFKFIQQLATGAYVHATTQRVLPVPFDHVRMYSNMNNWGAIGSLKGLVLHYSSIEG